LTKNLRAWIQLFGGFVGFGIAVPLMIGSGLGLGPWDAFHLGVHDLTGISVGTASILIGLLIVLAGLPIGIKPGPGTVANMIVIGLFIDLAMPFVRPAPNLVVSIVYYAVAIALAGFSTGMYMGARLGYGPRDGFMVGLSERTGWSVRLVRTAIELAVLLAGWAMGGRVGIGTLLFALTIGPATQVGLQLFGVLPRTAPGEPVMPLRTSAEITGNAA
jgi:uncharacterized protein